LFEKRLARLIGTQKSQQLISAGEVWEPARADGGRLGAKRHSCTWSQLTLGESVAAAKPDLELFGHKLRSIKELNPRRANPSQSPAFLIVLF
jgi:hypothetical protein